MKLRFQDKERRQMYKYLLERIRDSIDWGKGMRIWADSPCAGWRVIRKEKIKN